MRISDWSSDVCSSDLDSTLTRPDGTVIEGIRDGNRLSSVPKFQMAANATYSFPIDAAGDTNAFVTASFQHVGSRYTQPGAQENNPRTFVHGFTFGGAPNGSATTLDLKLPDYQLVNLGGGHAVRYEPGVSVYGNYYVERT